MAGVTFLATWSQNDYLALGLCVALLSLLIAARVFGFQETRLVFRHLQAFNQILTDTVGVLRTRMFLARFLPELAHARSDHWGEVTRYVRKMGGLRLELIHWNEKTQETIARLDWTRDSATIDPDASLWQFTCSAPLEPHVRASVVASGRMRTELRGQRLVDLFRLFEALCEHWDSETVARRAEEGMNSPRPDSVPLPQRLPDLLPSPAGTGAFHQDKRTSDERRAA